MIRGFTEFLRGANGGIELNRLLGAFGGVSYIIGANAFTAWHIASGNEFDLTAYCLAFPGGLAAMGLGTAGAVAIKDRNVAAAKVTETSARASEPDHILAPGETAQAAPRQPVPGEYGP